VDHAEPEHRAAVGEEVPDLVARLEVDLRWLWRERQPPDDGDQSPADRDENATAAYDSPSWRRRAITCATDERSLTIERLASKFFKVHFGLWRTTSAASRRASASRPRAW